MAWNNLSLSRKGLQLSRCGAAGELGAPASWRLRAVSRGSPRCRMPGGVITPATLARRSRPAWPVAWPVTTPPTRRPPSMRITSKPMTSTSAACLMEVAQRCEEQQEKTPTTPTLVPARLRARSLQPEHLGGQGAAQGLGGKIKHSLTQALELEPRHADAHVALGAYHAEVIDKVGSAGRGNHLWGQEEIPARTCLKPL
jgi:hypothetical protein